MAQRFGPKRAFSGLPHRLTPVETINMQLHDLGSIFGERIAR
jgi:hypothetical protein